MYFARLLSVVQELVQVLVSLSVERSTLPFDWNFLLVYFSVLHPPVAVSIVTFDTGSHSHHHIPDMDHRDNNKYHYEHLFERQVDAEAHVEYNRNRGNPYMVHLVDKDNCNNVVEQMPWHQASVMDRSFHTVSRDSFQDDGRDKVHSHDCTLLDVDALLFNVDLVFILSTKVRRLPVVKNIKFFSRRRFFFPLKYDGIVDDMTESLKFSLTTGKNRKKLVQFNTSDEWLINIWLAVFRPIKSKEQRTLMVKYLLIDMPISSRKN